MNRSLITVVVLALGVWPGPALAQESVRCQGQDATIVGTDSSDEIEGTQGDDVIHGMGGTDRIEAKGAVTTSSVLGAAAAPFYPVRVTTAFVAATASTRPSPEKATTG